MDRRLLFLETNEVKIMIIIQKDIEKAIEYGLFGEEQSSNENQVFDFYGNYSFPTDFSNSESNTILSISQYNNVTTHNS